MSTTISRNGALVSYLTLRRIVGILGVALPVILALWGFELCHCVQIQPSVSAYYGLRTRDVFEGTLFTIAWFLFTYKGYERKDEIAGSLACVFALGVALFPESGTPIEKIIHFTSAAALFSVLAYFSLFLFTKSKGVKTPEKKIRNRIYVTCGISIVLCVALIAVYYLFFKGSAISALQPVFWLESLALWSFGFSWFVKGETLFKDAAR